MASCPPCADALAAKAAFDAEALVLSAFGGAIGAVLGTAVTAAIAPLNGWPVAIPPLAVGAGLATTLLIGAVAGLWPAARAARIPPTAALNG
jgi:putative ABC transport system permease protein